ncbi:MAG: sulfatase, partial [Burkholderiales bacterium]
APDAVARAMAAEGRPFWIRRARDHYDAALRHHDRIVARSFEQTRASAGDGRYVAWMYLSDHGQEVGHEIDHAGHSAHTAAGFRIPAVVWQSRPRGPVPTDIEARPFRADWGSWTLAHLLALRWRGRDPQRDALDTAYRWQVPVLATGGAGRRPDSRGS